VTARFSKSLEATDLKTLLVATDGTGRIAEAPRDVVLIRVSFLNEHDHCVRLSHSIPDSVVVENKTIDAYNAVTLRGSEPHALVDNDGAGFGRGQREQLPLDRVRVHSPPRCTYLKL